MTSGRRENVDWLDVLAFHKLSKKIGRHDEKVVRRSRSRTMKIGDDVGVIAAHDFDRDSRGRLVLCLRLLKGGQRGGIFAQQPNAPLDRRELAGRRL